MDRLRRGTQARGPLTVGVIAVLIVLVALLLHFAFMGPTHHGDSGCATCLTVVVVALLTVAQMLTRLRSRRIEPPSIATQPAVPTFTSGRHPPIRSVLLRL